MMKKKSDKAAKIRGTLRNKIAYSILRFFGSPFLKRSFVFKKYKPKSDVYLVVANHNSDGDPFFEGVFFKKFMRYVASEHLFRKGFLSKIMVWLVNPIPRKKAAGADDTVNEIQRSLKCGVNVCIHAEGNRSFNGETGFISPRTGQMVKDSVGGLITFRLEGGYLRTPRWSSEKRKGKLYGGVVREYTRKELDNMSAQEIQSAIERDLYVNEFERQRKEPKEYKAKNPAENLETVLYICPKCHSVAFLKSKGDKLFCEKCAYTVTFNKYGFFEGEGMIFDNILDWDKWQRQYIFDNKEAFCAMKKDPIAVDMHQHLILAENQKSVLLDIGTLSLYGDRIEFLGKNEHFVWSLADDIKSIAVSRAMKMFISADGHYYEIKSEVYRSALKYFAFHRILTGKPYM